MRTALITTTINVPTVLELYRQHGPDVAFFVAIDEKTSEEAVNFCAHDIPDCRVIYTGNVEKYKCAPLIGLNSIQRRNLALLEAVKWGADIIVSVDDDNIPLSSCHYVRQAACLSDNYFAAFERLLDSPAFDGIKVSGLGGWFDVGSLLDPPAKHRGFPMQHRDDLWRADPVVGAKVGVAAGICLGDPDVDAVTRIERAPEVHRVSQLLESGIVVDPGTHTVFNSQNSAIIRKLAPAWGMVPFVQRYDDILASLVCARVMRQRDLHIHFGKPFVHQQRNQHNLLKDLRGELLGMEIIKDFAFVLDDTPLQGKSVVDDCREIWATIDKACLVPEKTIAAMLAYVDDCEGLGL